MKFLCICQGGNVRSVALATELKQRHRQDAVAVGYQKNGLEVLELLSAWADFIVVMRPSYIEHVPNDHRRKVVVIDVGEDTYGASDHVLLRAQVRDAARRLVTELKTP